MSVSICNISKSKYRKYTKYFDKHLKVQMGVLGEGYVDEFQVEVKFVFDFKDPRRQIHCPVVYEVSGGQRVVSDATFKNG